MYCRARTLVVLIPCLASGVLFAQPGGDAPEAAAVLDEERSLLGVLTDPDHSRLKSVTLFWDNDGTYPNLIEDTDRFYTSGQGFEVGLSFTPPDPARFAPGWEDPRFGMGFSLKQHIYTASDIEIADPDPDDHPYAGWLSFGFSFQRSDAHRHDHFGVELGVVGSHAFGEDIQKWVHDEWPDEIEPQGWDTQLANELAVNAAYQRTWRTERAEVSGFQMDMLPAVRLDAGNVLVRARGQATLRVGWNLPDDFGPASFLGIVDHTARGWADPDNNWSVYAYATVAADAVARNIFLDGNTFADSRSTSHEPLVTRATLGVVARYKRVQFGWAQTFESVTFRAQPDGQTWGSLVLQARFTF